MNLTDGLIAIVYALIGKSVRACSKCHRVQRVLQVGAVARLSGWDDDLPLVCAEVVGQHRG